MAFIGNTNTTQAFAPAIDYFNGNGSTVAFTLSRPVASVAQVQVVVNNVQQNPADAYTVSGNTITFTSAPSSGTSNIYVYYTSPVTQVVQPSTGTVGKTQLDVYGGTGTGAMTVPAGTTAQRPSNPLVGDTRWNTTLAAQEIWNGISWQIIASTAYSVDYLVVAGGGSGGANGTNTNVAGSGGGGGGVLSGSSISVSPGTAYTITIGAGGAAVSTATAGLIGTTGGNSSALGYLAFGGGYGAPYNVAAGNGGSGGGASGSAGVAGAGTTGQGFAGGPTVFVSTYVVGCGGGGGGAVGGNGSSTTGGAGGIGFLSSINGTPTYYAGGGGCGGSSVTYGWSPGAGGLGGGGAGASTTAGNGVAGTANTGGGGGGSGSSNNSTVMSSGAGGSGVVIIRYAGTTARATGGTITITGGYVIHTFTTSGTFTA